jgi:cytochrome P450
MTNVSTEKGVLPGGLMRSPEYADSIRRIRDKAAADGLLLFDPFDPRFREDPNPLYAELRSTNPIHRSPLGFWVFTRHADCMAILRDRRSSSDGRNMDQDAVGAAKVDTAGPVAPTQEIFNEMAPFLFRDPPDHTRLRGLVQKAFTPRVVESLRHRAVEISTGLVDNALEKGELDLVHDFAHVLPVRIIAEMLGVPDSDLEVFKAWSDHLGRGLDPDFLLPPEAVQARLESLVAFIGYFAKLIEDRKNDLGDDLLSKLIAAEDGGVSLSQGELISTCILLLVAGHETTVNLISGGILELVRHPDQLVRFRDDPTVLKTGVEEMLRYVTPVQLSGRSMLEDIEIGGHTLHKGEFVMVIMGSANRDPDVFTNPETFDVGRTENPHMALGFGIHFCLGAALARLEAQVIIPELLRRTSKIEILTDKLNYRENIILRGLSELPVRVTPA